MESIRTKDLGEVGDMLSELVVELRGFSANQESKGLFPDFSKVPKIAALKASYDKADKRRKRSQYFGRSSNTVAKRFVAMLDEMYKKNLIHFKELSMYILAGKTWKNCAKQNCPKRLKSRSGLAEDSQVANDLAALYDRFEKETS